MLLIYYLKLRNQVGQIILYTLLLELTLGNFHIRILEMSALEQTGYLHWR